MRNRAPRSGAAPGTVLPELRQPRVTSEPWPATKWGKQPSKSLLTAVRSRAIPSSRGTRKRASLRCLLFESTGRDRIATLPNRGVRKVRSLRRNLFERGRCDSDCTTPKSRSEKGASLRCQLLMRGRRDSL